jgi:hypothetical protein
MMPKPPTCPYCQALAVLFKSSERFYNGRDWGPLWVCEPCEAWVGCHPKTHMPLGRLANRELREEKMRAHAAFDPLWKSGLLSRREAYRLLAKAACLARDECHIGMFDVDLCKRVTAWATRTLVKMRHEQEAMK